MIKKIVNVIKLCKYSDNALFNFITFLIFTVIGTYMMITTESTAIASLLMFIGAYMLVVIFLNLSTTESIMASPLGNTARTLLPNIIMMCYAIISFTLLTIMISLRCNESSSIYSIFSIEEAFSTYILGTFVIVICVLILPTIFRNFIIGTIAGGLLYVLFVIFVYYPIVYIFLEQDRLSLWSIYILCFLLFIGAFILTFCTNFHENYKFLGYKLNKKRNPKLKYIFVGVISSLAFIAFIFIIILKNMLTSDGMYDYSKLNESYETILQESSEEIYLENVKVTLEKYYYDSDTNDACCILRLEGKSTLLIDYEKGCSYFEVSMYHEGHKPFNCDGVNYDGPEYCAIDSLLYINTNATGSFDMEYEIDDTRPNTAYVYLYLNMLPEIENLEIQLISPKLTYGFYDYYKDLDLRPSFYLKDNVNNPSLENVDEDIVVSNSSLVYTKGRTPKDINIIMKDGEKIPVMSNSIMADGVEMYQTNEFTKFIFNELVDISEIKDIEIIENENIRDIIENDTLLITENSHMRKTIYYDTAEGEDGLSLLNVTATFEWIQMPKHRFTDIIDITFCENLKSYAYFQTCEFDITQKVYDNISNQWIEESLNPPTTTEKIIYTNIEGVEIGSTETYIDPYDYKFDTESNVGYEENCDFIVFPTIYADDKYSNQTITIKFSLEYYLHYSRQYIYSMFPPEININYTHYISDFKGFYNDEHSKGYIDSTLNNEYCAGQVGRNINYGLTLDNH